MLGRLFKQVFIFPIRVYKKYLSPLLGDHCRFYPSCSVYAMQAIEVHGVCKGLLLGAWRIARCNPFGKTGLDPVPPKGCWRNPPAEQEDATSSS